MVGINVPIPVPLAYYTFGGWKRSGFGDLNQHGPDAFRFYTKTKTVTSRWPSGIKDGADFVIPTMHDVEGLHVASPWLAWIGCTALQERPT
jgi:malonate-semialdehyde dehydrogenase (acetylating)/methylmalonate-semialdehyde dehydrogenase